MLCGETQRTILQRLMLFKMDSTESNVVPDGLTIKFLVKLKAFQKTYAAFVVDGITMYFSIATLSAKQN